MSKYVLRNEASKDSMTGKLSHWLSRVESPDVKMRFAGKESFTERARTSVQEWSEKSKFINAAGGIPYAQGILLYILALSFPFFSLLLLVPGKHGGFLLWFMLWIWVKSWDVMMALVIILSDSIYAILTVQMQGRGYVQGQTELNNMGVTFALSLIHI